METARLVAQETDLPLETDDDLCEMDFGEWEGKTFEEIRASDPNAVDRWAAYSPDWQPPGGESLRHFRLRAHGAIDRLSADPGSVTVAVTHGGVIRAAICHLLGLEPKRYLLFDVQPASVTTIRLFDGKGVLHEMRNVPEEGIS
jgi:broad specificity phosphatase PhoE